MITLIIIALICMSLFNALITCFFVAELSQLSNVSAMHIKETLQLYESLCKIKKDVDALKLSKK